MVVLRLEFLALLAAAAQMVAAQQAPWGQCGGIGHNGPTTCTSGHYCNVQNPYYSQCIPGSPPGGTVAPPPPPPPTSIPSTPTSPGGPVPTGNTLHAKIRAKGRNYFGTCADRNTLTVPQIEAIILAEYGQVTPENSMKWESIQRTRGSFTPSDADYLVDWAQRNGKLVRGHTLVWHSQLPSWVSAISSATELTTVIEAHIAYVAGRYRGKIYHWDVVNEVFEDSGVFRNSVFYRLLGERFIEIAFRAAKRADPDAKLYINDYNLDYSGPKLNAMVALVNRLRAAGVPIDGIGSQAHLVVGNGAIPNIQSTLTALANTGISEVAFTEVDIRMTMPSDNTKLQTQRTNYNSVTAACINTPKCVGITIWGVSDRYSWVPDTFSGQGAALPWDQNYSKKPAYDGISAALN